MTNSIRQRLNIVFISLAIVPLLLVGGIVAWQSFNALEQQALSLQEQIVQRVLARVKAFLEELENELNLARDIQVFNGVNRDMRHSVLRLIMVNSVYNNLLLLDSQGRKQVHLSRLDISTREGKEYAVADEFIVPKESGEIYYSSVRFDEGLGEPLITMSVPLKDLRSGFITGVLIAEVRLKKIWELIADIQVGPGQDVYIVDSHGQVVAHRNPSVVLRGTRFDVQNQDGIYPGLDGDDAVIAVDKANFGDKVFNVVAEQTTSEAFALAYNSVRVTIILIASALLVAGILGFLVVRQVVLPIQSMAETAQAASGGDLSRRVEVKRNDELGILAEAFNSMIRQIQGFINNLEQQVADRTQRLEAAQRELLRQERLATLGKVTATVAHEIRNPLATVNTSIFSIGAALNRNEPDRIRRALELAERNVKRCDNIIAELLDYTKKLDVKREEVNIDKWLKEVIDELTRPEEIEIRMDMNCGQKAPIDREQLRRAVVNIITNAFHALSEDDSPGNELAIETAVSGRNVEIRIIDNGPGIPEEMGEKIFEPLFSTKVFGVGLGLSITKEIMEKHQGGIDIQSRPGKGTTVILWIPLDAE